MEKKMENYCLGFGVKYYRSRGTALNGFCNEHGHLGLARED